MNEFSKNRFNRNDIAHALPPASPVEVLMHSKVQIDQYGAYIGLDVHKDTIAIAVAEPGRSEPHYKGEIANTPKAMLKLMNRLNKEYSGELLLFCYEAGPCGYVLFRQITKFGHECQVIAPSLIPSKPSDHIKTDRRDGIKLARSLRSGDLTPVWVPDEEQEAMRDLTRTRGEFKARLLRRLPTQRTMFSGAKCEFMNRAALP
jgi:transposase